MKIELFHKELLLVACPLLFQVALIGMLFGVHNASSDRTDRNYAEVSASQSIIVLSGALQRIIEKPPENVVAISREYLSQMREAAARLPSNAGFDESDYQVAQTNLSDVELLLAQKQSSTAEGYFRQLKQFCLRQARLAEQFIAQCRQSPPSDNFASIAVAGILTNVLLTVWLTKMFNTAAAQRLFVLQDNTERLRYDMTLHTPVSGVDGFAQLDQRFHEMAQALREAQESLRRGEARFRLVLENMPVGVLVATNAGVIEQVNPKACKMFCLQQERAVGKSTAEFFRFAKSQTLESIVAQGASTSAQALREDGSEFTAELHVSRFRADTGDKLLLIVEDVTAQAELERMKRDFMAMVSHDIRTPLTAISATLAMIAEGAYGQMSEKGLQRVSKDEAALDHLMRLLNDLLSIEKMGSSSFRLTVTPTRTASIVDRALSVVSPAARSRGIKIKAEGDAYDVDADEDRLVQVLSNLLTNAIKFSPEGGDITLAVRKHEQSIEFKVVDQGVGIPKEEQARIFDRYGQAKSAEVAGMIGIGLGLAICKQIVEEHGGTIGVISEPGQGSAFFFTVPEKIGASLPVV